MLTELWVKILNYKKKLTKEDIDYRASLDLPDNSYDNLGKFNLNLTWN